MLVPVMALALLALLALSTHADILVYGGSAAGVMAAIEAAHLHRSVLLVAPERHLGGMSVEGLGSSDINNHTFRNDLAVGGLAREFYTRIGRAYGQPGPVYKFESHVAEQVIEAMLAESRVKVFREHRLREPLPSSVARQGPRLAAITTSNGARFSAAVFIDASIEGDLLAAAGVSTTLGREPNAKYGEQRNGIRAENPYRNFTVRVDPYQRPGDPASGLIPTIQDEPLGTPGAGDRGLQGYCFRLCLTRNPANRIPIPRPPGFDRSLYEIYFRYLSAGGTLFFPSANLPNGKTDLGSWHDLSLNLYGMNRDYPEGSFAVRARVIEDHRRFAHGLLWLLQNDPGIPEKNRREWEGWGLCRDEFTDNGGWPRQLYVRSARRMVSDFVLTENHLRRVNALPVPDPVAVAFWPPDTHHVRRIVRDGAAYNEGFVFGGDDWGPFGVSYRALVPRPAEAVNLLAPACPSSSHIAYGAIRLEWTFLALGQAAGAAAALSLDPPVSVQLVDYARLRNHLVARGAVLQLNLVPPKP